jgi:putative endonuclease
MKKKYFIYIVSNKIRTTFYIGVTNNLERRVYEHKQGLISGFTQKYNLKDLIYFEEYKDINDAINREKQLKNWHRDWKINLIKKVNPQLDDLSNKLK